MSLGPATGESEARQSWVSRYPFEPFGGGQGASITASGSSSSVALVGVTSTNPTVNCALICNTSAVWVFVQLGNSSVVATTSSMAIPPGACELVSLTNLGRPLPTNLAAITASGSAFVQVTLGFGGN